MQPSFIEPRPPHIDFESRAVERRKTAEEGGTVYYVEQDYIIITPHGSKDRVERVWAEYEEYLVRLTKTDQFPRKWLEEYRLAYAEWKKGNAIPVEGVPVRNWPVLTSAEVKILIKAGVRTVEELATANEQTISAIGMGARSLKQRAIDYLMAKENTAPLVAQLDALRAVNAGLEHRITELTKQLTVQAVQRVTSAPVVGFPEPNPFVRSAPPEIDDGAGLDESLGEAISELSGREVAEEET